MEDFIKKFDKDTVIRILPPPAGKSPPYHATRVHNLDDTQRLMLMRPMTSTLAEIEQKLNCVMCEAEEETKKRALAAKKRKYRSIDDEFEVSGV